jgi:hypothetical protein
MRSLPNIQRKLTFSLIFLATLLAILSLLLIYSDFIYYIPCSDESCFFAHLRNCDRAEYTKTGDFNILYKIEGDNFNRCNVKVFLEDLQNSIGLKDFYKNSFMECNLKFGFNSYPESDLISCSGMLKEGLQEVLIHRLKSEVARNIGEINLDIFGES